MNHGNVVAVNNINFLFVDSNDFIGKKLRYGPFYFIFYGVYFGTKSSEAPIKKNNTRSYCQSSKKKTENKLNCM